MRAIRVYAYHEGRIYTNQQIPLQLEYLRAEDMVDCWLFELTMMQREMVKAGAPIGSHRWETVEVPCLT